MNYRSTDRIKNILTEQIISYRTLLDLLQRERGSLVQLNAEEIEKISKEKDTIVLRLRLLEDERKRLVDTLSAETRNSDPLTLQKLCEITGDQDFQSIRLQLRSLLQSIEELNAFNMILIGRSLSFINNSMHFLGSFGVDMQQKTTGAIYSKEI
jgi:flagellar biosynthesis/type III secretory pathway chaperone